VVPALTAYLLANQCRREVSAIWQVVAMLLQSR
jgi:hypothetical protein